MVVVCGKKVDTLLARKGPAEPQVPLGARGAARAPSPAIPRLGRSIAFDFGFLGKCGGHKMVPPKLTLIIE